MFNIDTLFPKKTSALLCLLLPLAVLVFFNPDGETGTLRFMAAIAVWMAAWWLSESVHPSLTAAIPLLLLPISGICPFTDTLKEYFDKVIFLFAGGFVIAIALEKWGLHKRISLKILMIVGSKPSNILLGVMLSSFLISMWISNTATTLMLFPAVLALVKQFEVLGRSESEQKSFATALLIGLAYSATIGGMATLVGTPTNMIFYGKFQELYPDDHSLNFASWMYRCLPLSLILLAGCYFTLRLLFLRKVPHIDLSSAYFRERYQELGPMHAAEKRVATLFLLTAILWFTREDIDTGLFLLKGWKNLFPKSPWVNDSSVAVVMALLLLLIPSGQKEQLIRVRELSKVPLDILILFGGGFAMAKGFEASGLSTWLADSLTGLTTASLPVFLLAMCLLITVISELASNVACIQLMLPILAALIPQMQIDPLKILIPATLAASLGFMLPVATAPNTIVYGSKYFKSTEMMKAGFVVDLIGIALISLCFGLL